MNSVREDPVLSDMYRVRGIGDTFAFTLLVCCEEKVVIKF